MKKIGDKVTIKFEGVITSIEQATERLIRYKIDQIPDRTLFYCMITDYHFTENEEICEHCGREFPQSRMKMLAEPNGEDDYNKVGVCQECFDYAMDRPEP